MKNKKKKERKRDDLLGFSQSLRNGLFDDVVGRSEVIVVVLNIRR